MSFKLKLALSLAITASILSGCGSEKGSAFEGHWVSEAPVASAEQGEIVLDITADQDLYHVDVTKIARNVIQQGDTQEFKSKLEAKAESDSVLSLVGGLVTMRLQDGKILYEDKEFVKTK